MAMNHFSTSTDNVKKPQFAHPGKIGSGEISFSFEYFFQKTIMAYRMLILGGLFRF